MTERTSVIRNAVDFENKAKELFLVASKWQDNFDGGTFRKRGYQTTESNNEVKSHPMKDEKILAKWNYDWFFIRFNCCMKFERRRFAYIHIIQLTKVDEVRVRDSFVSWIRKKRLCISDYVSPCLWLSLGLCECENSIRACPINEHVHSSRHNEVFVTMKRSHYVFNGWRCTTELNNRQQTEIWLDFRLCFSRC